MTVRNDQEPEKRIFKLQRKVYDDLNAVLEIVPAEKQQFFNDLRNYEIE